jgi:hypothetical protein
MIRKFESRKQITIYLDQSEYEWLERQSGGNLSHWCRERILQGRGPGGNHKAKVKVARPVRAAAGDVTHDC